jgi:hypothetical protein
VRLWLYVAALAALAGAGLYLHHLQEKASRVDAAEARAEAAENQITAERAARAHEQRIAKEASDGYQNDLRRLEFERASIPVVRLRKCPASVSAGSAAAAGPDAAGAGRGGEEAAADLGPDIGAALIDYGISCEANALQLTRLQEWVLAR